VAIFVKGKVAAKGTPHQLARQGAGPEILELEVGEGKDPLPLFSSEPIVKKATPGRVPDSWTVTIERGGTARLVERMVTAGIPLTSIHRTSDDLDEVYRRYFEKGPANV
jgi:hypothetical protein